MKEFINRVGRTSLPSILEDSDNWVKETRVLEDLVFTSMSIEGRVSIDMCQVRCWENVHMKNVCVCVDDVGGHAFVP